MSDFRRTSLARYAQRYIAWYGQEYTFMRLQKNEFGEVRPDCTEEITLRGIYHDGGRKLDLYRVLNMTTYGTYLSESMPQIFCLWEDAKKLQMQDMLIMNDMHYVVTGTYNVHELNTMGEISLDLIQANNIVIKKPEVI